MRLVSAQPLGRPAAARTRRRRQRRLAWPPDYRAGHDTDRVGQPKFRDLSSEIAVVAIRRVSQCDARWHAGRQSLAHLLQGDLGLGLKPNVSGYIGDSPTNRVVGPVLWQIQSVGHRQAALMGGHRETHRYLAVVLLAQLAAILPGYTDRVAALLRKPGVIDDPGLDWFVSGDRWQHSLTHTGQHRLIRPGCLRHKMQQRLVLRRSSLRRSHCRQWFDALATLGGQQPDTIVLEWSDPVGMAQHRRQVCRVGAEPRFRPRPTVKIHPTPPGRFESPLLPNRNRVGSSDICLIILSFLRLSRTNS